MVVLDDGIRLRSGALFNYERPHECEVLIEDIASALSKVCRFAGHIPHFYSVAQHVVNTSRIVAVGHELDALMHDTAEAFTNDLPTPLKHRLPEFRDLERRIEAAMAQRFGFNYPLPHPVKVADLQMLKLEKHHIKRDTSRWSVLEGVSVAGLRDKVYLDELAPRAAEELFLTRYYELKSGGDKPLVSSYNKVTS